MLYGFLVKSDTLVLPVFHLFGLRFIVEVFAFLDLGKSGVIILLHLVFIERLEQFFELLTVFIEVIAVEIFVHLIEVGLRVELTVVGVTLEMFNTF